MTIQNQPFQNLKRVTTIAALGGFIAVGSGLTSDTASAQGFDKNPIEERLSADNQTPLGDGATSDNAISRGIDRTTRGLTQGESVGDAVRGGLREGARSTIETPAQQQLRDQRAMQQGGDLPNVNQSLGQAGSTTIYQDETGRTFFLNPQGQRIYANQPLGTLQSQTFQGDSIRRTDVTSSNSGPSLGVGLSQTDQGMRIESVLQNSVAANAGLQAGDVITSFNGTPVQSIDSLKQQIQSANGQPVDMKIVRNGEAQSLTATFDQNQSSGDRYQSAKPTTDDSSKLKEELDQLRSQFESMQKELDELKSKMADQKPSQSKSNDADESNVDNSNE